VGFLPVLWTLLVAFRHVDDAFENFDSLAHARMELSLHCVQVVVHVLAEANQERERLIKFFSLEVLLYCKF
jgi:hypothetical protein